MDRTTTCPACKHALFEEDAYCSACGTSVRTRDEASGTSRRTLVTKTVPTFERQACRSCNSLVLSDDVFCSTCGAPATPPETTGRSAEMWAGILRKLEAANEGTYRFLRELGRGGMGTVYLAQDLSLDRPVAIKVLSPNWLTDDTMVERFSREAKTIARLRHPSIVTVYGVGRAEDLHYFVMDYIEGASLSEVLRTHGPLSIPVVKSIVYQVGSALSYAHRPDRAVIHRDIKPSNIVLDTDGNAFLMDFGISKVSEAKTGLTRTGIIMGTPEYMSPEQCRGHGVGPASDQYSMGTVIHSMLTGAPPYTGASYEVLVAHNTRPPPDPRQERSDCPTDLADATLRMLAKAPPDRWPDIGEAVRATGARPLSADDPAKREVAGLVAATAERRREGEPGPSAPPDAESHGERTPTWLQVQTPSWLRILKVPETVRPGDTFELEAAVGGEDGAERLEGDVGWESADPSVVRVDPETGQLVAVGEGAASITARSGNATESVVIEVRAAPVARVAVSPTDVELAVGRRLRLTAEVLGRDGRTLDRQVSWSSSDPATASVTDDGDVDARVVGGATIHAECEGVAAAATVRVFEPAEESAAATKTPVPAPAERIDAPTADAGAAAPERPPDPERRGPGRRRVVPVALGVVAAVALGTVVVLSRAPGAGGPADVSIQGPDGPVGPAGVALVTGERRTLTARVTDGSGTVLPAAEVAWAALDPLVATVEADGVLLAVAEGATRVTAAIDTIVRSITVDVRPSVSAVIIETPAGPVGPAGLGMDIGDAVNVTAVVNDDGGEPLSGIDVSWAVLDPTVASYADATLTALAPGSTELTASVDDVTTRVDVTVVRPSAAPDPGPDPPERAPADGTLQLTVRPAASRIVVDGVLRGENTGELTLTLPPGPHRVQAERAGREPVDTTFTVVSGQESRRVIILPARRP